MFDYQRVTARIGSRQRAPLPVVRALASACLWGLSAGLLSACGGGKMTRDEAAQAPPPPPPPSAEAPAPAPAETAAAPAPAQPAAEPVVLSPSAPQKYVVKRGDTLWGIASRFLRDPWFWPEIWYVNPQIENPHLIYPGDSLTLGVGADGRPQVQLERGAGERLSPQVRTQPLEEAIKAIPYEIVASFMSKPSVLEKQQAKSLPYVLAGRDEHVVTATGDEIYVMGLKGTENARYNIVHIGDPLVDPDDHAVVGYQGIYTASARLARPGSPAKMVIAESARETVEGDRVVSNSLDVPLDFVPHAPDKPIKGRIISVIDGVTQIGQYQVVIINRGQRHGLEPGNVLAVFQKGRDVKDVTAGGAFGRNVRLPDERAGVFMVFKTFDRISYGLIMEADHPLLVGDVVGNP
jgi:hypothetical protein